MDSALNSVNPSSPNCPSSTEYCTSGNTTYYRNSLPPATATSNAAPILRRLSSSSAGNSSYYEVNRNRLQRRIEGTQTFSMHALLFCFSIVFTFSIYTLKAFGHSKLCPSKIKSMKLAYKSEHTNLVNCNLLYYRQNFLSLLLLLSFSTE